MPTLRTSAPGRGEGGVSVIFARYFAILRDQTVRAAQEAKGDAGEFTVKAIRARTRAGIDVRGRRFVRYRPSTAEKRKRAGLQTGRVDLTFRRSDSMLDQLAARKGLEFRQADVYFKSRAAEKVARFHIFGTAKMVARQFFGLTPAEVRLLSTEFRRKVVASIPRDRRHRVVVTLLSL